MTYRYVPKKWLRLLQVLTLLLTAIMGLGIVNLPETAAQLSKLEETLVSGNWFGWMLFGAGLIGGLAEIDMWTRHHDRWTNLVASMHIIIVGLLGSYFVVSLIGVLNTNPTLFLTPTLVLLMTFWHMAFVQRKPTDIAIQRALDGVPK